MWGYSCFCLAVFSSDCPSASTPEYTQSRWPSVRAVQSGSSRFALEIIRSRSAGHNLIYAQADQSRKRGPRPVLIETLWCTYRLVSSQHVQATGYTHHSSRMTYGLRTSARGQRNGRVGRQYKRHAPWKIWARSSSADFRVKQQC